MSLPKAYRLKSVPSTAPIGVEVGTIVYASSVPDYGLSSDDERMSGVACENVSLLPSGVYPCFVVFASALEEIERPTPTEPLTDEHVKAVCKPGAGPATCRYLMMDAFGWSCERMTGFGRSVDLRAIEGTMTAVAINCDGRAAREA